MNTLILISLLIITSLTSPVSAPESPVADDAAASLATMTWLNGAWEGAMWGGTFKTWYSAPAGGKILSHSELHTGGKVVFHEFELFEVDDGKVVMRPYPKGRPAVPLTATSIDAKAKKAVFENPTKDYPTRITYHREGNALTITLDDPHGEGKKSDVFKLARPAKKK